MNIERLNKLAKLADDLTKEYSTCCIELGLNPKIIHPDISKAPNYSTYYKKAQEYTAIAKVK